MGELLTQKLNEIYKGGPMHVQRCAEAPFEEIMVDLPEMIGPDNTPVPALRGQLQRYWILCDTPEDNPYAFAIVNEIHKNIPPEYNNVGWVVIDRDEQKCKHMGIHFLL